ncbi:MAG: ATP-binding cassette domain-containing protein [Myxococcota bacterium]
MEFDKVTLEVGDKVLVRDLTLALAKGERVGILGPNGAGKTSLLRAVLGQLEPASGRVVVGKNTTVTYLGQRREGLIESETILENVSGGQRQLEFGGRTMSVHGYLERFLFDGAQQRQPVSALSGGEKARVLLAKLLLRPTNLLVLDEPTNDLDVMTLAALEELILELGVGALVVTHDRFFLDRIATSILSFEGKGEVVRTMGDYTMYRALRTERQRSEAPPPKKPVPKKPRTGLSSKEKRELASLLEEIDDLESEASALEATLADPSTYAGGGAEAPALVAKLEACRATIEEKTARWEELESRA